MCDVPIGTTSRLSQLESCPFDIDSYLLSDLANEESTVSYRPLQFSKYCDSSYLGIMQNAGFNACSWNCHLTSSYDEIFDFLLKCRNLHVMALCETFLSKDSPLSSFDFPGYQLTTRSRASMNRGGLGLIVSDSLKWKPREDLDVWREGKVETLSIEIEIGMRLGVRKIILSVVYKPPSASYEEFTEGFQSLLMIVQKSQQELICMGDFNFDLLSTGSFNLDFLNFMVSNDLFPTVTIPTRITDHSATLIDNVFVSSKYIRKAFSNIVVNSASDHFPVVFSLDLQVSRQKKQKKIVREIKPENIRKFKEEISATCFESVLNQNDPCDAFEQFSSIITTAYDKTCPLKTLRQRPNMPRKPWADEELVNLFEQRDSAFQDYLRSSKKEDNAHFKKIRNMANSLKRKKK